MSALQTLLTSAVSTGNTVVHSPDADLVKFRVKGL